MLAAVLHDFNNLLLEDIPIPDPGPGEVLIQIQSCGFCATDFKAILGIRRNVDFPLVPGHEPAGIVAAIGDHVTHVKEGDDVIIPPSLSDEDAKAKYPAGWDEKKPYLRVIPEPLD